MFLVDLPPMILLLYPRRFVPMTKTEMSETFFKQLELVLELAESSNIPKELASESV